MNWSEFHKEQEQLGQVSITRMLAQSKKSTVLPLPIFIGRSATCDVVINSSAFDDIHHVLYSPDGRQLALLNLKAGQPEPLDSLKSIGISFSPLIPSEGRITQRQVLRVKFEEAESKMSSRLPGLKSLSFNYRMAIYAMGLLGGGLAYSNMQTGEQVQLADRFAEPITMAYETLFSYSIDSVPEYRDYRNGVQFVIPVTQNNVPGASRLSFDINDLNEVGEFDIAFNGHKVATIGYDPNCITSFCNQSFLLPAEWWAKDNNSLAFVHKTVQSNYAIQNILIQPVSNAKEIDRLRVSDRLYAAERLYGERSITPKNLVTALQEAKKIIAYANAFNDLGEISNKAQVLQEQASKELTAARSSLSFEAERQISLGQLPQAVLHLNELKELYGEAEQADRQKIDERIEKLNRRSL